MRKMKACLTIGPVLLAFLLATACIPSLHPFFEEKDVIAEPAVEGTWGKEGATWTFTRDANAKSYTLTAKDQDQEGTFTAHLFRLGEGLYADLFPKNADKNIKAAPFYQVHLVPAHSILKLNLKPDQINLQVMNPNELEKILEADPKAIAYEKISEDPKIVFTAATPELQAFVLKHADQLFKDQNDWMPRLTPAAADKK